MSVFRGFGAHSIVYSGVCVVSQVTDRTKIFLYHAFLLVLVSTPVLAQTPRPGTLTLADAVILSVENSPQLAALRAQSDAMSTMPSQVSALPDPMLSLNAMNLPTDSFQVGQVAMTQMQIAVSQQFPFPGKRKLRRDAAMHQVSATESMLAERRVAIAGEVRAAWWELMNFDRAIQIVERNKELMRDFIEIVMTKYKVGDGLQQDVLLAQLELSRLLDRELRLRGVRKSAQAKLNVMMDRSPDQPLELPTHPASRRLPILPTEQDLLEHAGMNRDLIDVQRNLVQSAQSRLDLAKKDRYPDFKLGVGYGFRSGIQPFSGDNRPDLFSVMLSMNVPLYFGSKQRKAVEQHSFEVSRQQYILQDTLRNVEAAVSSNLATYNMARDQVELLETAIIPQAKQTVASMLAGYQVNEVDFLNLVNTQITLYNAQLRYWESLTKAKQALAVLASATGQETLYE